MNTIRTITLLGGLLLILNACTPKMSFNTSTVVPAAAGNINIKKDKNDNYTLKVSVRNLAESSKLTPVKDTYLIWMKQNDNSVKKLGQLKPTGKALTATAEDNADILYPAGQTILTTED